MATKGTRVGVFEGEVEVRSGALVKRILQGQQYSTSPEIQERPLTETIAWSRRAAEFGALLPQSPIVAFTPDPVERLVRKETIPSPGPSAEGSIQQTPGQLNSGPASLPPGLSRESTAAPAAQVAGPKEDPRIEEYHTAKRELEEMIRRFPPGSLVPDLQLARLRFERANEKLSPGELEVANKPEATQPDSGADSAGVQVLNKACGLCHSLDIARSAHFDNRDAYAALVSRQVAFGASLTQSEFNILVDYMFKTYSARQ